MIGKDDNARGKQGAQGRRRSSREAGDSPRAARRPGRRPRPDPAPDDRWEQYRMRMVSEQIQARGLRDEQVLDALRSVPRHRFVPEGLQYVAYEDGALSIGHGQTISQPYMVALMTELLCLDRDSRLLEVGTGSGYQAAVAAHLCREVWTVERVLELAERARLLLADLGYTTVHVVHGDGTLGLPDQAPFQAIIVTAAAARVPPALFEQLVDGGRLVVPVGSAHHVQTLMVYERHGAQFEHWTSVGCRFVPLIDGSQAGDGPLHGEENNDGSHW